MSSLREGRCARETGETAVRVHLALDGRGKTSVTTGLPFLDHMLDALARHAGWDLEITARGDLEVDDHHTVEDVALALGTALDRALGERRGLERFGDAHVPLDEALARAVVDLSGRPSAVIELELRREQLGTVASENLTHFFRSLATTARMALHLDLLRGENDHHKAEAAFKATARALRAATTITGDDAIPSTKGTLS